jgi:hypothetical protein
MFSNILFQNRFFKHRLLCGDCLWNEAKKRKQEAEEFVYSRINYLQQLGGKGPSNYDPAHGSLSKIMNERQSSKLVEERGDSGLLISLFEMRTSKPFWSLEAASARQSFPGLQAQRQCQAFQFCLASAGINDKIRPLFLHCCARESILPSKNVMTTNLDGMSEFHLGCCQSQWTRRSGLSVPSCDITIRFRMSAIKVRARFPSMFNVAEVE